MNFNYKYFKWFLIFLLSICLRTSYSLANNNLKVNLLNEISDLLGIMELYPDLQPQSMKRILFAISYFCDEDDEIPDIIPDYGYLDDAAVVHWVIDHIKRELPGITRA